MKPNNGILQLGGLILAIMAGTVVLVALFGENAPVTYVGIFVLVALGVAART